MAEVKITDPTADTLRQRYPSNSITERTSPSQSTVEPRQKVKPVVSGKAVLQKETFGEKIRKTILPGDIKDIKSYILKQVIIPGIQATIISSIEMMFYGQTSRRPFGGPIPSNQRTNYNYISSSGSPMRATTISQRDRMTHNFRNVIFESAQDVEDVISTLIDLVERTGIATVADYYDACGIQAEWSDENWGWKSFQRLESRKVREGYIIDMQPPVQLR